MTKRRSRVLFIFLSILLVICLLFSFVSFALPFKINGNYYSYTSFLSNIRLGQDIGKNISVIYRAKLRQADDNYNTNKEKTISALTSILKNKGYYDIAVSEYSNGEGDRGFKLDIGNTLNKTEIDEIETLIGDPSAIGFSSNFNKSGIFAGAEIVNYITIVSSTNSGELQYYVLVVFTKEGLDIVANNATSGFVCLFLGDNYMSYYNTSSITEEQPYYAVQSSDPTNREQTINVATRLMVASLPLDLTKIDFSVNPGTYGNNAGLVIGIALIVVILAVFAYFVVKFGQLGWLACFNIVIFVVLGLFFLQAIPTVHVNLAGVLGVLLSIWLVANSISRVYDRAKGHYQNGMKLYVAVKSAETETMKKTLIIHSVVMATGFITMLFTSPVLHSFGWTTFVLSIVSLFVSFATLRLFNKMYFPFNNSNGTKCHFNKGGNNE